MKKILLSFVLMLGLALCFTGCEGDSSSTRVRFTNNSPTRTVVAVWDGMNAATLAPGQTSSYQNTTPGRHTIQWKNTSGSALTSIGWPDIAEGSSYSFPYN
jgi:hypothetical protein